MLVLSVGALTLLLLLPNFAVTELFVITEFCCYRTICYYRILLLPNYLLLPNFAFTELELSDSELE